MPPPKDPKKYEEYRKKMSEVVKKRFEDPIKGEEYRKKMSEAGKKRFEDPIKGEEIRKKMSEAAKGEKNPFFGKKHSEASRRKLSEALKNPSVETRRKMSVARRLRAPASEEDRQKMREILTLRYADPIKGEEIRRKISEGGKGKTRSEATRKKMSDASKLRAPPSVETRRKMSVARRLRAPVSEETRRKQGEAHKGSHRTNETRRKQSEAQMGEKGSNWMGGYHFFHIAKNLTRNLKREFERSSTINV